MNRPVVLDIDHSVGPLPGRLVLPLEHWQETVRFGCSLRALRRFRRALDDTLPLAHGTVMLGSGDFHHLSWPLIERVHARVPFQVVVLDSHPDNMRHASGVHCDSWVRRVAMLPQVSHVHVVGISSGDAGRARAWKNHLAPLHRGRLSYWCLGVDVGWARRLGLARAFHGFDDVQALVGEFCAQQRQRPLPTYLSIDKNVFAADVVPTGLDQGRLQLRHALGLIQGLAGELVGSDITGEVSSYRPRGWLKRWLPAAGEQAAIDPVEENARRARQHALNLHLLEAIATRMG